jgi:hypothetical protein
VSSSSEGSGPELSIVLLTFSRWDRTSELLASFLADEDDDYSDTQLVWVDNGCSGRPPPKSEGVTG